ncbi:MAG: ATP-binding cassette domain-containing protein [Thermoanaerobaculia bacterium]
MAETGRAMAIEARGLRKVYRTITALAGIDLQVAPGELFGLLGPNGAGKTTTVKILLGLTRPTEGNAAIHGIPVSNPESRRKVGYLPEGHRFPGYLTARETLSIFGRMSGVDSATLAGRIPGLLSRLHLEKWANVRVKKFSKGMVQRLGLAAALVHDPDVLLLDEPTDGVDPVGRREIRDLLLEEARKGKAVLVNSHLLSEIELTCGRVAILREGKIVAQGAISDLTKRQEKYRMFAGPIDEPLLASFRETGAGVERENGHVVLSVRDTEHLNVLVDRLRERGGRLSELAPVRSSLEDVFVGLFREGQP